MKRVDSETLQFVNKTNTNNFKSSNSKEELIELSSSGDTEFIDVFGDKVSDDFSHNKMKNESKFITNTTNTKNIISNDVEELELDPVNFVDDFYNAIGSNRLSKETGMEYFESLGLLSFIDENDIKKVEKSGSSGKDALITLKDGSSYLFSKEEGKTYLSSIRDKEGREINFGKDFENFINTFKRQERNIEDISMVDGNITFNMTAGDEYTFDMETKNLREISYGETKYSINDINNMLREVSERVADYLNDGSTAEDIMNKYNLNLNIDNISTLNVMSEDWILLNVGDIKLSIYNNENHKYYAILSHIDGTLPENNEYLAL